MAKSFKALLLALALVACSSERPQPPAFLLFGWTILYSTNVALEEDGTAFNFPYPPGSVHYVMRRATVSDGRMSIRFKYRVDGAGEVQETDCGGQPCMPCQVRLIIQRAGDTLKAGYENYRFWSGPVAVQPGEHTMEVQLDANVWTNVVGKNNAAGFFDLINNLENVGFTFGGMFAGHGCHMLSGNLRFTILEYDMK
jgi:hypothetical protein